MTPQAAARIRDALAELGDAIVAAVEEPAERPAERLLNVEQAAEQPRYPHDAPVSAHRLGRPGQPSIGRRRVIPASAVAAYIAARRTAA